MCTFLLYFLFLQPPRNDAIHWNNILLLVTCHLLGGDLYINSGGFLTKKEIVMFMQC
jgi:hypothetical protein